MNDTTDSPENATVAVQPADDTPALATPSPDPRRRLRELLAIPERDRTDAEWDEINELEIQLAPGNRIGNPAHFALANKPAGGGSKNRFRKMRKSGKAKAAKPARQG